MIAKDDIWNDKNKIVPTHGESDSPLISIVTPSFNQARFIHEALNSSQIQNYSKYEHLVIDGMSTDGTIELLQSLSNCSGNSKLLWFSEKDRGQSEALNKGFRRVKGDIIGWLNSDDRYLPGCFAHVVEAFAQNPEVDIVYGDYRIVDELGNVIKIKREIEFSEFILLYHRVLYIPTTATFFRSRVFKEENWLEENLQYAMDLELFMRLAIRGYRFKHISKVLADFRLQPNSKTCSCPNGQRREHRQIVYSSVPLLRNLKSPYLRSFILFTLRAMAGAKRSYEKMVRGYYWDNIQLFSRKYLP
jgi:glycosyltransferase involved in cell wall biosynthesis